MPLPLLAEGVAKGFSEIPYFYATLKTVSWLTGIYLLKRYFGGASNTSERLMHSKVVMITGGTSGIGAVITRDLAARGAQIILLTQHPSDPFLVGYIDDLRAQTNNDLIYAEQVDLSSLHSIRLFATKWVDNAPPRRLDMIVLCAATMTPPYARKGTQTVDKVEVNWGVNYLANYHLLSILSPAIKAQPPDRDVRIIFGTCSSYIGAELDLKDPLYKHRQPSSTSLYGSSKLALMVFAQSFQKHLDSYSRPDKQPTNARVIVVDPGWSRTPGMRRWLTMGSLWGLLIYVVTWPLWWLVLKSPEQGAQTFLRAVMEAELGQGVGGRLLKECREVVYARKEVKDDAFAKELWEVSSQQIEILEKEGALKRAQEKKAKEEVKPEPEKTTGPKEKAAGSRRSRKAG
ncbi:MAG: RNA helicase [Chaenotheca gracillima]|nr:MAG: RNA helicase [Chaenotheca gracillima]